MKLLAAAVCVLFVLIVGVSSTIRLDKSAESSHAVPAAPAEAAASPAKGAAHPSAQLAQQGLAAQGVAPPKPAQIQAPVVPALVAQRQPPSPRSNAASEEPYLIPYETLLRISAAAAPTPNTHLQART